MGGLLVEENSLFFVFPLVASTKKFKKSPIFVKVLLYDLTHSRAKNSVNSTVTGSRELYFMTFKTWMSFEIMKLA